MFKIAVKSILLAISIINTIFGFHLIKNEKDNLLVMILIMIVQLLILFVVWGW